MQLLNFDRVLCLSPHPDDVEYSMAGTIIKFNDTIFDVLCLSHGGDLDLTTNSSRVNEVRDVWLTANCNNVNLHFSDNKFLKEREEDAWVNFIETNYLRLNNYDCIMTTSQIDSHFEHKLICNLGPALTRGLWPNRTSPISLIEYKSPSTLDNWIPNMFIDISNVYDIKLNMLTKFKSQQHHAYFDRAVLNAFHSNYQCAKKNMLITEQFRINQTFI